MNSSDIKLRGMRKRMSIFVLLGIFLVSGPGVVGCSPAFSQKDEGGLPDFAYSSRTSLASYKIAVEDGELLSVLPCYCGCGTQSVPHHNLKQCFIRLDGTFESHASGCDLCGKEALDAKAWKDRGFSPKDIRAKIEQKYQDYGTPTDTPPLP